MKTLLQERIEELLRKCDESMRSVSLKATGKADTIRDILRGKIASPRAVTIQKIAAALGVDPAYLTGDAEVPNSQASDRDLLHPARVVGLVQAGAFMELDADDRYEIEPQWIPTIKDADFPYLPLIAFEIAGDSVDKVCAAGGHAVCLPFAETGLEIKAGMFVVVHRKRGGLIERTIKKVEGGPTDFHLVPASTNPKHKPIHFPSADREEEITVFAVVRRFISPTLPI